MARPPFLLCALVFCLGCVFQEFPDEPVPKVQAPRQLYAPVEIRIHPSSAVMRTKAGDDFDGLLIACEADDRFGDPIKATGVMRFEVYEFLPSQPANKGDRLKIWPDVPVDSLQAIEEHWDGIWSLYRFNLDWDRPFRPQERFILEVTLITPGGRRLYDRHTLQVPP